MGWVTDGFMDTDNFCHPYLQVKFNVSNEVTFQNGFNVSDETLKMGTESTDPIIPIYDK